MIKILMNKDIPVLKFDFDDYYIEVLNNKYLPFMLKDYVKTTTPYDYKKTFKDIELIKDFLIARTINISRTNAKQILISSNMPQSERVSDKLKIVFACRALSMEDNYWLKEENENIKWNNVNLRNQHLSDVSFIISIIGKQISATAKELTPDLMTKGSFPKCWFRKNDKVYMIKTDIMNDNINTKCELKVSKYLEELDIYAIKYKSFIKNNRLFAVSECFANDTQTIIDGFSVKDWCFHNNTSFIDYIEQNFLEDFSNMCVLDYVFANTDRHLGNILFTVDDNNEIIRFGPLHDHNLALIADYTNSDINELIYDATELSMIDTVKKYAKYSTVDFSNINLSNKCKERLEIVKQYYREDASLSRV